MISNPLPSESRPLSTQSTPPLLQRSLFSRLVPWLVLIAALASTFGAWRVASMNATRLASERFENRVEAVKVALIDRLGLYQQLMRAGAALFAGSENVSADEWRRFYDTLRVAENYPGLLGFGFAQRLTPQEREPFIQMQWETNNTAFNVWPPGDRPEYSAIIFFAPVTGQNAMIYGYDMFSEPVRRAAMLRAAASGQAVISGKVALVQDQFASREQPGFVMYQPVYRGGTLPPQPQARHAAVLGYVYGAFRMRDLMQAVFGLRDDVAIEVYDGVRVVPQAQLYAADLKQKRPPQYSADSTINVGAHSWTLRVTSRGAFEEALQRETPDIVAVAGSAISGLLFALTLTLSRMRERSLEIARGMTAELKENEQRLLEITASLGEGVYVKSLDGAITFVNPEAEKLLGWSAQEVLGHNAHAVYHHHKLDGSEFPLDECPIVRASRSGQGFRGEDYFWHKNGSVIPVAITSTPIYRDGKLAGAVNVFHDITERRRHEAQLRESEQFRALFDYAREALFLVDATGFVIDANQVAAESLACESAEILGRSAREFMLSPMWGDGGDTLARLPARASPDSPLVFEGQHIRKDGSRFPVEALFSPIRVGSRELILIAARDITERKRAEEERRELLARERDARQVAEAAQLSLARSNADLEHFAYAASHDLQEPLRMVTAYNQLLHKRYFGKLDDEANRFIEYSIAGAQRMEQLLQALLSYLRVAAADEPAELVDANGVLQEAIQNLHTVIEESAAVVVNEPLPQIRAHAVHVLQLFQNLIGNAIKYRGSSAPHIAVSARRDGEMWIFSIADNGIGIEPRYARQIFGIFKRLHGDKYSGTGIGLAICQKIVERYGGKIWVDSEPARGSVFHFSLPA